LNASLSRFPVNQTNTWLMQVEADMNQDPGKNP
jgi:hypothetical protein